MKFEETKRRKSAGAKTSVDLSQEQVDFFDDYPELTKKTVWDLGACLAFALKNNKNVLSVTVGKDDFMIVIKGATK